jgi:hypothetical protein
MEERKMEGRIKKNGRKEENSEKIRPRKKYE